MFAALNAGIAVLGRMEEPLSAGFQRLQDRLEQWVRREDATSAGRTGSVVNRTRVIGVLIASGAGGLACAQLVLSEVRSFSENMSAGMGYLGVVAVIAGPGFTSGPRWLRHRVAADRDSGSSKVLIRLGP